MKKRLFIIALAAVSAAVPARADVTNYVYTVSNIYIRTSEVRYITNRVQNTHYNYYYTNNVTTITNIWTITYTTNFHYDVVNTNFGPWIVAASNQANRASAGAVGASNQAAVAANYATLAGRMASSASASAVSAQTAADAGLYNINARIAWFDAHIGEIGRDLNTNIVQNVSFPYIAPDGTVYSNILYHVASANGRVSATPTGTTQAGTSLILYYNFSNRSGVYMYVYDVGYVSSDAHGMLIRYVPRCRELKSFSRDGTSRLFLPRDLIWQNGAYTADFYIYDMSTNWIGRWTVGGNKQNAFPYPDNIRGDLSDDAYMYYYPETRLDTIYRSNFTGHPNPTGANLDYVNIKTEHGSYLSNLIPLWIPSTPTSDQQKTLDWLDSFPHQ